MIPVNKVMKIKSSYDKLAIKYGLLTTLGLVAFFLIMKLVGLVHIVELRALNFFILCFGIWKAISSYLNQAGDEMVYLRTLGLGVYTSLVAVLPFSVFLFFYLNWDTALMQTIIENEIFGQYLNPYILAFLIFFEGTISGFFIAFILMQYMKKNWMKKSPDS